MHLLLFPVFLWAQIPCMKNHIILDLLTISNVQNPIALQGKAVFHVGIPDQ